MSQQANRGRCRRICKAAYTTDMDSPLEDVAQRYWMELTAHMLPGAVLSHRTAIELKPHKGSVYVTGQRRRNITLPGLIIRSVEGETEWGVEQLTPTLRRTSLERRCLENLQPARERQGTKRTLGIESVEGELSKTMQRQGEQAIIALRQQARSLAPKLGLEKELQKMDSLIGALLATRPDDGILQTPMGKALARKEPYDAYRLQQLQDLSLYLRNCHFLDRPQPYQKSVWRNQSFFESYFSNYIVRFRQPLLNWK